MGIRLPSPLFVGGGTIEGQITLDIDEPSSRKGKKGPIFISQLSVDVIGLEEVSDGRRWIFLSLASELFDEKHPPPPCLVSSQAPSGQSELFWPLRPSSVAIPFCLNLPLNLGPPPYLSKHASIRYLLCPSAAIKVGDKRSVIRQTWNVQMLTVYDPEKALASLPRPLVAADTLSFSQRPLAQYVKLTAGLHRQTWVNGATIFVDLHVVNNTNKCVKTVEVQLEKTTLWYSHTAAATGDKTASHLRLPRRSDHEIVQSTVKRKSKEWPGISPFTSDLRTCELEVPRGHVTISTGRYFEVRYFLNVVVGINRFKTLTVQLPVTIIHINSLDILPNSLAQVAASIEAKRAHTDPTLQDAALPFPFYQGQAFSAPRHHSFEKARMAAGHLQTDELGALTREIDASPRRAASGHDPVRSRQNGVMADKSSENTISASAPSSHHHPTRHPSCYHCHLACVDATQRSPSAPKQHCPRLPRLQISTSGLGFSDSEFGISRDSPPRKVMLSELERKMIRRQRELRLQRQVSQKGRRTTGHGDGARGDCDYAADGRPTWKNVAAGSGMLVKHPMQRHSYQLGLLTDFPKTEKQVLQPHRCTRARSKTNPEKFGTIPGPGRRHKSTASLDKAAFRPQVDGRPGHGESSTQGHIRPNLVQSVTRSLSIPLACDPVEATRKS